MCRCKIKVWSESKQFKWKQYQFSNRKLIQFNVLKLE